jgi:hypothetical protein
MTIKEKLLMENTPIWDNIERLVVEPIVNGVLVTISTEDNEQQYSFKSYRQVMRFMKSLNREHEDV